MNKILFILFMSVGVGAFSQTDLLLVKRDTSSIVQKKFDSNTLEKYSKIEDFNYVEEQLEAAPSFFERVLKWAGRHFLRLLEWIFGMKYASGIFAKILSALPYIIAGIVLLLLLKFFLKVNSNSLISSSKNRTIVSVTEEEDLIKTKDITKLIQLAIERKNYRLAVRYYYLNILKQLAHKELIIWEQQKTNEDYIQEIMLQNIRAEFVNLTRLYDFVWYGNFRINEIEFAKVEIDFVQMNNLIQDKKFG